MSVEDKQLTRMLMRELTRHQSIDISDTQVSVAHQIAFIGGVIRPGLGVNLNVKDERRAIEDLVKRIPGLNSIVIDAKFDNTPRRKMPG